MRITSNKTCYFVAVNGNNGGDDQSSRESNGIERIQETKNKHDNNDEQERRSSGTVGPFGKLVRRVYRLLVLFMPARHSHARTVVLERVRRHGVVHVVIVWDLDFTGELDVVVL